LSITKNIFLKKVHHYSTIFNAVNVWQLLTSVRTATLHFGSEVWLTIVTGWLAETTFSHVEMKAEKIFKFKGN
jgi:hypothetical protein